VEKELGRRERCRWCEREIDLDIIYYDSLRVDFEDLKIPHPDRLNRTFVLQPLAEIEPTFVDFSAKKTAKELLLSLLNPQGSG
jgi:7,8-dihydro-6-hydroxymethylpterin-pyrophosphokinase